MPDTEGMATQKTLIDSEKLALPAKPDPDRDDELLDEDQLAAELDPADARAVLGPHTALPRWEIAERLEMLRLEREGRA